MPSSTSNAASDSPAPQGVIADDEFPVFERREVVITMAGVMLALFLAALDQTIVSTAMPRIILDLGGFDRFTWISTAYLVSSTTVVPIAGRLSDLFGRRIFYLVGIVVFLIGSALAGFSQSMNQLIIFRAIQGLGGGILLSNAFITIGDLFPPADRGKWQGVIAAVFGVSSVFGPVLGGAITDQISWNWIFFVNLPIGIPVFFLFVKYFPKISQKDSRPQIDYLGILLLILAVVPGLIGLSWGGVQYAWGSWQVAGSLIVGGSSTLIFVWWESKTPAPIMPLGIFKNRIVGLSLAATFLTGFGMFGGIVFIPLFFQAVLGLSATSSGSFLTPMMLGIVFGAGLSGQLLSRAGGHYRRQGVIGVLIMTIGAGLLSTLDVDTSRMLATVMIVILGFGLGSTFPLYAIAIQNTVPHNLLGIATSSIQFFRSIGGTLGLAVFGSLMIRSYTDGLDEAFSPTAREAYDQGLLESVTANPQALVDPRALDELKTSLASGPSASESLTTEVLDGLRISLAAAIGDIFLLVTVILIMALVATIVLKEIPLKGRDGPSGAKPLQRPESAES